MIQELLIRNPPIVPFRFKRYFEARQGRVRVFGQCEVTGRNFELFIPTEEFFIYTQGFKNSDEALKSISKEERGFISKGISPEGQKSRISSPSDN
jgi:hypothetical protein